MFVRISSVRCQSANIYHSQQRYQSSKNKFDFCFEDLIFLCYSIQKKKCGWYAQLLMVLVQMVLVADDVFTDGLSANGLSHCALCTYELRIDALSTETL